MPPHDDIDAMMDVMKSAFDPAFGEAWTRAQLTGGLLMPGTQYSIIRSDGRFDGPFDSSCEAAGFAVVRTVLDEAELMLIAVAPRWRGRGYGRHLLIDVIDRAAVAGVARLFLEMRSDNPARALYEGIGFCPVGRRPGYYKGRDGTKRDAVTYAIEPIASQPYY
ncbi:GNAT family N-acetyltransferase [Croceicoccus sp. YJ47]|uniref:GNAT family N-acetyltransferase n=1 Tax=Croceicoccus sp. YJ47 TaxID=2798724 RepID=UPI001F014D47|nr:GNAT family N-acetyltransferase [Croceicoccus sp. YJ47]